MTLAVPVMRYPLKETATETGAEPFVHTQLGRPVTPLRAGLTPIGGVGSPTALQISPMVGGCASTGAGGGAFGAPGANGLQMVPIVPR